MQGRNDPKVEGFLIVFDREALIALFETKALKRGDFTLASGKKSSYYLDGKQVTLDSGGAVLIAEGILELLTESKPTAVGGMSIGADPITAAVITLAGLRSQLLLGFMVRKEPKTHGTKQYLEGPVQAGMKVAIVEDVVTTGSSSLQAINRVEDFGCQVVQVIAIVDRLEGGREVFAERGYPFASLLTIRDFGIEPPQ